MALRVTMMARRITSTLAVALLVGCTTAPIAPGTANAQQTVSSAESQLFYELLVAELAIRRGDLAVATEGYLRATDRTDDPRVAERATQLTVYYQQWDTAETTAKRWLSLDPEAIAARETLAQIYLRQGKTTEAVDAFSDWVDSSDNKTDTLAVVNQLLLRDPDMALAYDVAAALAQQYPNESLAHVGKARLALSVNQRDDALNAANQALELDSTSVDALLVKAQVQISQGQSPDAIDTLQEAVSELPDSLPLHLGFAQLLVESELYDRAGPVIERAAELSEGDADAWLRLGLLSLTALRNDSAKVYLSGVLKDDPYNEQAHFYLARISDREHDHERAISHYDSVPQGEFFITARIRAAELTAESGDVDGGIDRIQELSPLASEPALKVQLISAQSRILQQAGRVDEAIDVLTDGLSNYEDNAELLYARALASENKGDNEQFEADLGQLLQRDPNNAHALNALGYHLVVNNQRLDEAARHLEKANALEPDDAAIMDSLGWLRFRQGRLEESKVLLKSAYTIFPDAEIAAHLGEVLWMQGDESGARQLWDKALADEPDHKVLNEVIRRFVNK